MTTPVLICDDSSVARKQMARSLPADWDIEISYAVHGEDAIEQLQEGKGEIMFLDLNMPVMDGYQTLEAILKNDIQTMVIVVSGDIQPEAHERVKALGALDFIKKPISVEDLTVILEKFGLYSSSVEPAVSESNESDTRSFPPPTGRTEEELEGAGKIQYRDCIQEISNVAMGQAADLLARLLDVFVKLPIPNVNILEVSELKMALSQTEHGDTYTAVCQGFIGSGIAGEALLIFSDSSYEDMAKLLKYSGELNDTSQLELIMDIASILVGACTSGIAQQLDISFSQGHPMVLGQHVKVGDLLKTNETRWKQTLAIEITYEIENYDITCDLMLLFTEDSIDNLNQRLSYLMD
ncbi:response regulator [Alkalimarinus sediminis]|uniref:Response regulator n=1 Tax=Alkalimarinus sediminis TaxID=1632866 RepID=A0A9E8KRV6_9ALTE|nr:response regulator [Alkalimarinus sediminis]UZW76627.1 response regulator [Alkalimarinus sediminis]